MIITSTTTIPALSLSLAPPPLPLISTPPDIIFHQWCSNVGLPINPSVQLITSPQSVAGRGVFAINDLQEGEIIARIPNYLIFHPENCAECFPDVAKDIERSKSEFVLQYSDHNKEREEEDDDDTDCNNDGNHHGDKNDVVVGHRTKVGRKRNTFGWIRKLWHKVIFRKQGEEQRQQQFHHVNIDDLWQSELTLYALEAIHQKHPWSEWILQWKRDDPTYRLFQSNTKSTDEGRISEAVKELHEMIPYIPNSSYFKAALAIRLGRFEELCEIFPPLKKTKKKKNDNSDESTSSAMYALLGSRAIAIDESVTGVIPFHDMINHSLDSNLSMTFRTDHVEIYTDRPVEKGQELFLCYTEKGERISEMNAVWALVQWGIPTPESLVQMDENTL